VRRTRPARRRGTSPSSQAPVRSARSCQARNALKMVVSTKDTNMPIERRNPGKRLCEAVVFTPGGERTVYLAGQVADDRDADMATQTRQVLASIDRLLADVGSDKARPLSATIHPPE